jgi:PIN domain nuclease of toxin-antitoxin system
VIVLDTHALLWWVSDVSRLSARARRAVAAAVRQGPIGASAISLFEIATAARRGRLELSLPVADWLGALHQIAELRIEPVGAEIAELAGSFPDSVPGDPADRIIAATAIALRARLVTADVKLRKLPHVQAVW